MTVQRQNTKNVYVGDGITNTFPYTFEFNAKHPEWIKVYVRKLDQVLVPVTNFSIDRENKNIIYPTSGAKLQAGETIVISRVLPIKQELNLVNSGPFFAEDIETTFDDETMMIQQINEITNRALILPLDSSENPESVVDEIFLARDQSVSSAAAAAVSESNANTSALNAEAAKNVCENDTVITNQNKQAVEATKTQVDSLLEQVIQHEATTQGYMTNAAQSASQAGAHEQASLVNANQAVDASNLSVAKAQEAGTHATNAAQSENLAQRWAESSDSPDGITGHKSAKTWATESSNSASYSSQEADRAHDEADRAKGFAAGSVKKVNNVLPDDYGNVNLIYDDAISLSSENAIQNKTVTAYIQNGYIPKAGGNVITGDTLGQNVANKGFVIRGGFDNLGSYLVLTGKNFSTAGQWELVGTVGGNQHKLALNGSGGLTFDNKSVVRSINNNQADNNGNVNIPSLPNPYSLTINGTEYDGSAEKTVSITPESIGALKDNGTLPTNIIIQKEDNIHEGGEIRLQYSVDDDYEKYIGIDSYLELGNNVLRFLDNCTNGENVNSIKVDFSYGNGTVDTIDSIGQNYIRYGNGIQITFGKSNEISLPVSTAVWSHQYPLPFISEPYVSLSYSGRWSITVSFGIENQYGNVTTQCDGYLRNTSSDATGYCRLIVIAIGRWK